MLRLLPFSIHRSTKLLPIHGAFSTSASAVRPMRSCRAACSTDCGIPRQPAWEEGRAEGGGYWDKAVTFEDVKLLAEFKTPFNLVRVLEIARHADHPAAGCRFLLLDKPGNVQSIYNPYRVLTDSYYDVFATLPPLLPHGPLAVLGLGAGTTARLLFYFWRGLEIHGWEIDPAVVAVARQYFGVLAMEEGRPLPYHGMPFEESPKPQDKSRLSVHIGDALHPNALCPGRFAGIIVDLFSEGVVVPSLQKPEAWENLAEKLMDGGRIMVNCGGSCVESEDADKKDGHITMEETLDAMSQVFYEQLLKIEVGKHRDIIVALTGPAPDLSRWRQELPDDLRKGALRWLPPSEPPW